VISSQKSMVTPKGYNTTPPTNTSEDTLIENGHYAIGPYD